MPLTIQAESVPYHNIERFRRLYIATLQSQVYYEVCHDRGWADYYRLSLNGSQAGYAALKGMEHLQDRDSVFEFFLLPHYRQHAPHFFRKILSMTGAQFVEAQTNTSLLAAIAHAFCDNLHDELWLLCDDHVTHHHLPGVQFRKRLPEDQISWLPEDPGDYVLTIGEKIVAEGGILKHYNPPFTDIHMSVAPSFQGKGIGTFFVQELKKVCYSAGGLPVAHCQIDNLPSRETLQKAGMAVFGKMIWGTLDKITELF